MKKTYLSNKVNDSILEELQIDLIDPKKNFISDKNSVLNYINKYYTQFETNFPIRIINKSQFDTPVNFKQAKSCPIHRWYTYKEGFSPIFVNKFIQRFKKSDSDIVFDPFGGIGTTVIESGIMGLKSYSNDINPLSNFIAKAKSESYSYTNLKLLEKEVSDLSKNPLEFKKEAPSNITVSKYFTLKSLDAILRVQYWIDTIENKKIRNLIFVALLSILETISTHRKDGNGVKRKKNFKGDFSTSDILNLLTEKIKTFIYDIEKSKLKIKPTIFQKSSFDNYQLSEKADLVITSPPYANCFDYSKVYLVELWFGGFFNNIIDQKLFRESSVTSHVHYRWNQRHTEFGHSLINKDVFNYLKEQVLWDKKIPNMLVGYFSDMGKVLYELSQNLNNNSTIGIVVGNSVYGGVPIATDILLSEIALNLGYKLYDMESYRTLTPSSQQLKIIREQDKKFLRESLIILKWN